MLMLTEWVDVDFVESLPLSLSTIITGLLVEFAGSVATETVFDVGIVDGFSQSSPVV